MQWLASISVRRPVLATVLILLLCVLGVAGYVNLGIDRFPKIDFPVVVVVTRMPGAAPREVETEVTERIEEAVNTLSGIDELNSSTFEGVSQVIVTFVLEKNVDVAVQEVRDKVQGILAQLPKSAETPVVNKVDPDAIPVMLLAVNANAPVRDITEIADKRIKPALETLNGIGDVTLIGGRERQVHVWLNPQRLRELGLTAIDVSRTVQSQNMTAPAGALESGSERLGLRFQGRIGTPAELERLVIKTVNGHPVTVGEVARVEDGEAEPESYAARDGKQAVVLQLRKQSGTNTVALTKAIRARAAEIQPRLPPGYTLDVIRDTSEVTQTSVHAVQEHLIVGAILAALVVLLFLGSGRSTFISALAIPISIVGTFALMQWKGFTLNTISLLALALAVGIVIDDAIVVLENIYRFIHEKKMKPFPAAIAATKEIGLAVLATTLSLVAVFLPMAFMSGVVGRFLESFGWTMAFSILVSLLVSFTLTPMLAARLLVGNESGQKGFLERLSDRINAPLEHLYGRVIGWSLNHRWVIVVGCFVALGSCIPIGSKVPKGFLPRNDEGQFEIPIRAPEGTSLQATQLIADRIARQVREYPEVTLTLTTIGDTNDRSPNVAKVFVKLVPPESRLTSQDDVMGRARDEVVAKLPKTIRAGVQQVNLFAGGTAQSTAAVQYRIAGPDLDELSKYAQEVVKELKTVKGAVDVDTNLVLGRPEARLTIDRARAADHGVEVSDIATTLQLLLGGVEVSSYEEGGDQYPVRVRAERNFRQSMDNLDVLTVPSRTGAPVPLLEVVTLDKGEGPASINRTNRQRQVMVLANTAPGVGTGELVALIEKKLASMNLPALYQTSPVGQSKEIGRTARNFGIAFALAFIFMFLVLAAQFESWLHPLTILMSLPLTVPFALLSLLIFKQQLDIFSMLGVLVLFGVVKKNSILQVDHTLQLRREGMEKNAAIIQGSRDRLRPILMTTFAFVAGMVPLLTAKGVGAGFNRATAGVVVGGQMLSLLLTLVATPVIYSLMDSLATTVTSKLPKSRTKQETGEAELESSSAVET
ncbi:MAG: efflux RND transporter permease subunit [Myxococcaceae bacterium]|nr:efflux RND transporter permease subunit [Myxococcaceae bacterium]